MVAAPGKGGGNIMKISFDLSLQELISILGLIAAWLKQDRE